MPQSGAANTSKLNAYAVLNTNATEASKLNAYAVLNTNATEVSKLNVYAVLVTVTLLSTDTGSFSVAGVSAGKVQNYRLSAASGSVALTGIDAYLPNPRMFFSGPFVVTGQNATFRYNRIFPVSAGSFALTGQSAFGGKGKSLLAESRQFTLTGKNAIIDRNSTIDPFRNYVTYHHHCDDRVESVSGQQVIPLGNAAISTSVKKFGSGSYAFDGTGDYTYLPTSSAFAFSTAPFTMEGWFRFNTAQTYAYMFSQWSGGFLFGIAGGQLSFWSADGTQSTTYAFTPTPGQWYNLAVDRDASNNLRIYVDGVMVAKTTGFNKLVGGSSASFWTGDAYGFNNGLNGYADEIRLTKGVARYASDAGFTVLNAPFSTATLTCSAGSFAATGVAATFTRSQPFLLARPGAFLLQGQAARLNGAAAGSVTLTGQSAALIYRIPTRLSAAAGSFVSTTVSATLDRRKAILGDRVTLALVGQAAQLRQNRYLPLGSTSYALAGVSARVLKWPRVRASAAAFLLATSSASLLRNRRLSAGPGTFTASGVGISAATVRKLIAACGSFVLSGGSSGAIENQRLRGQAADFNLATVSARLLENHRVVADSGQFDATGQAASLERGWRLPASAGSFAWAGGSAKKSIVRTGRPGRFRLTGQTAELWAGWGGDAVGVVSSPAAVAQVTAQGVVAGSVAAPRAQAAWSDR